jgi:hypothetical protein
LICSGTRCIRETSGTGRRGVSGSVVELAERVDQPADPFLVASLGVDTPQLQKHHRFKDNIRRMVYHLLLMDSKGKNLPLLLPYCVVTYLLAES